MSRTFAALTCLTALVVLPFAACGGNERESLARGCEDRREIALTFDDGPNQPYTGRILDILAARDAKATFFVTGTQVEAAPGVLADLEAKGMAIGAHSYDHADNLNRLERDAFAADLARADDAMEAAGVTTRLFRAPFGRWSNDMLRTLQREGYTAIGWSIDSRDWSAETTPDQIAENVIAAAHPGAIVLLHDGGLSGGDPDRSRTIEALPGIIDALQGAGYALVTVPEILGIPQDGPAVTEPQCN